MILYDKNGRRIQYKLGELIAEGECSTIYRLSDSECIKVYKKIQNIDDNLLSFIKDMNLKNFGSCTKVVGYFLLISNNFKKKYSSSG